MRKLFSKILKGLFLLCTLLVVVLPLGFYYFGLSNVLNEPNPPIHYKLSEYQKQQVWEFFGGTGNYHSLELSPYWYFCSNLGFVNEDSIESKNKYAMAKAAYKAIWHHVKDGSLNKLNKKNLYWHITTASYSIWATRNWNISQIIEQAVLEIPDILKSN